MPSARLVNELHEIFQRNRLNAGLPPLVQCEGCERWNEPGKTCPGCGREWPMFMHEIGKNAAELAIEALEAS